MNFTLNVLGTASAKPTAGRNQSAQVLDVRGRFFLIDCGEGTQRQLCRQHIPFERIDAIFISHVHGDHILGLPGLISTIALATRRSTLRVFGPAALGPLLKFNLAYFGDRTGVDIDFTPVKTEAPAQVFENRFLTVEAFPLNHRIETYGYLFREKTPPLNVRKEAIGEYGLSLAEICSLKNGEDVLRTDGAGDTVLRIPNGDVTYLPYRPRSFAYCSDTAPFPDLPARVRGVDLLYHEATYMADMEKDAAARYHSTTVQAARCALEAGVGRLVVGHYSSRYRDTAPLLAELRPVFPESFTADDGDVFDVPLDICSR